MSPCAYSQVVCALLQGWRTQDHRLSGPCPPPGQVDAGPQAEWLNKQKLIVSVLEARRLRSGHPRRVPGACPWLPPALRGPLACGSVSLHRQLCVCVSEALPPFLLFVLFPKHSYWNIVDLQCASFRSTIKWLVCMYIHTHTDTHTHAYGAPQVALMAKNRLPIRGPGDSSSIARLGRSPEGGHDDPFRYSCLENPVGRGAWGQSVGEHRGEDARRQD